MNERSTRPPSMMEVAKLSGVSHQTVSRVLNNPDAVRLATRERVVAAMAELGYSRNMAARSLVTKQTALLGVVWTGVGYFGPSSTVGGIEAAARAAGYSTLVGALEEFDEREVESLFQIFRARGVEGIAVVAPHERMARLAQRNARGIPLVLVAPIAAQPEFASVAVDQELGARLVINHMVERGCRRMLHISGPLDWFDAQSRARGSRIALMEAGLGEITVSEGDWSPERGYEIGRKIVATGDLPDGIFCANDATAIGLLAALREAGVDVPAQVSVAGFDNMVGSAFLAPPLTTVAQPFTELGAATLRTLVATIHGAEPSTCRLEPVLVTRASVRSGAGTAGSSGGQRER